MARQEFSPRPLDLFTRDTAQEIADPQNQEQVFYGSFSSILRQNLGRYVICEFLIGTSQLVQRAGYLYSAGNNFLTLHSRQRDTYTVCDAYSLKFVTFFDSENEAIAPE